MELGGATSQLAHATKRETIPLKYLLPGSAKVKESAQGKIFPFHIDA